ncbi:inositol monophosphatase 2-like [Neocloeon triangulifer]|uniref:inositol monophosphatase 2-like n=1 Tax=Neocloeon triangulifer TaxID=2078957 RepID=UPI00286FAE47|nr:inositol monophosphatase 2-like [Neocloeon triangulifer]
MSSAGLDVDFCFEVALPLVKQAGQEILAAFERKDKKVESKSFADDLLTETDRRVEDLLIAGLKDKFPNHRFIAEERVSSGGEFEASTVEPTWIIDPIDGTTNFVHGYPQVCVSVGLWAQNCPQLAFVFNPVLDQLFTAKRGQGAFLNGRKLSVSKTTELSAAIVGGDILSYQSQFDRLEVSIANAKSVKAVARAFRIPGSVAITLAYVAMGALDAYFEQGPKSWDFAAGVLLVTEAGGVVRSILGEPFDLFGRTVLATSTENLAKQLADTLQPFPFEREGGPGPYKF